MRVLVTGATGTVGRTIVESLHADGIEVRAISRRGPEAVPDAEVVDDFAGRLHAVDAALWDMEAKRTGVLVWQRAGAPGWRPIDSAVTIGIRGIADYEAAARERAAFSWIKVKVGPGSPLEAVAAVRRGAPDAHLIVDANQSWTLDELREYAPQLQPYAVDLLEQPLAAGTIGRVLPLELVEVQAATGNWQALCTAARWDVRRTGDALVVEQAITLERHYEN